MEGLARRKFVLGYVFELGGLLGLMDEFTVRIISPLLKKRVRKSRLTMRCLSGWKSDSICALTRPILSPKFISDSGIIGADLLGCVGVLYSRLNI